MFPACAVWLRRRPYRRSDGCSDRIVAGRHRLGIGHHAGDLRAAGDVCHGLWLRRQLPTDMHRCPDNGAMRGPLTGVTGWRV